MTLLYAARATLDPIEELARLRDASGKAVTDALRAYIAAVASNRFKGTRNPQAELDAQEELAERMAEARLFADVLGRLRILRELGISPTADPDALDEADEAAAPEFSPYCDHGVPVAYADKAPTSSKLARFVGMGFEEAVRDLMSRAPVLAHSRAEVEQAYRDRKFTLIDDINRAINQQVSKRLALIEQVRDRIAAGLDTGEALPDIKDFLGELDARFSRPYAETVFRTNMSTAYAAGRERQARALPSVVALEYMATEDSSVRPNHLACDGIVAPVDDPVWQAVAPPNGFQCRCSTRLVTRSEAKRKGLLNEQGEMVHGLVGSRKVPLPMGFPVPGRPKAKPDEGFNRSASATLYRT